MTQPYDSFRDLIDCWPSFAALAEGFSALGLPIGIGAVKQWRRRDAIPSAHFGALIELARRDGVADVTADVLVALASRRRSVNGFTSEEPAA